MPRAHAGEQYAIEIVRHKSDGRQFCPRGMPFSLRRRGHPAAGRPAMIRAGLSSRLVYPSYARILIRPVIPDIGESRLLHRPPAAPSSSPKAACRLRAELGYMGTAVLGTTESRADGAYRAAVLVTSLDDVRETPHVGGLPANLLASWLDSAAPEAVTTGDFQQTRLMDGRTVWSAGHSVSGVHAVSSVDEVVGRVGREYLAARKRLLDELRTGRPQ